MLAEEELDKTNEQVQYPAESNRGGVGSQTVRVQLTATEAALETLRAQSQQQQQQYQQQLEQLKQQQQQPPTPQPQAQPQPQAPEPLVRRQRCVV